MGCTFSFTMFLYSMNLSSASGILSRGIFSSPRSWWTLCSAASLCVLGDLGWRMYVGLRGDEVSGSGGAGEEEDGKETGRVWIRVDLSTRRWCSGRVTIWARSANVSRFEE